MEFEGVYPAIITPLDETNKLKENVLMYLRKNFIVINENKKDKKIPINTKKLNSMFSLNKSFIPNALAPIKAGIDK